MAADEKDKQPDAVSSVQKVFGILQALSEERDHGITELAQRLMMSKSTVYRFLQTMKALGYVAQEGESEKYSLTLKLFEVGSNALQHSDLIRSADVHMRELSRLTKETIHLGALDDDSVVYVHKIDSLYNLRMASRIGHRNPLHSTALGKVLLAWRSREEVNAILERMTFTINTANTLPDAGALREALGQVRAQGYGEDNEEQEVGVRCIAVPVFDRFGVAVAGLSLSFPTLRFSASNKQQYVTLLREAGQRLSSELGYTGNDVG